MNEKTAGLAKARAERSLKKRRAVEDALSELKARNETITFKAVATLAGVGRPYLYNNFREIIDHSVRLQQEYFSSTGDPGGSAKTVVVACNTASRVL